MEILLQKRRLLKGQVFSRLTFMLIVISCYVIHVRGVQMKTCRTLPFFVLDPALEDFFLIASDQLQWVDKARSPAQKQNSE